MKTLRFLAVVVLIVACIPVIKSQTVPAKAKAVDYESVAQKLVNQCAGIKEGEVVLILGGVPDFELLEDITVNVRKTGAYALMFAGSDRLTRKLFTEVPVKYDSQAPLVDMKLLDFTDAIISVDYGEDPGLLADIPPERFLTRSKAYESVTDLAYQRKIRGVSLGNGLYPTEALAKRYGLTKNELAEIFWGGVNTDYSKLEATGKKVSAMLTAGKEVHITNANGTDLKVRIESRPVLVSDGMISAEDLKGGYATSQVYLPAGEVYLATVPGTAEGIVVVDQQWYQGKEIKSMTLTFKGGKMISMTAKSGIEPLKAIYDAAEPGKEDFSSLDIGINPDVQLKPGSAMVTWMSSGMLTLGIGNNIWAGGDNKNLFGLPFHMPGSTVKVDGKVLIENGVLIK